ncbi:Zinc transport protein ZntB [Roseovarius litorisediminis]|uniref:Zinc transport protein ZntB n=1 Tax=Roseovarius litorisediminis TaxID=1312363 RepID=A0A1Y5SE68_9RHOB|nr:zinc transporter ZntB [Roseovarius litorisediminis]SLN38662.1 Zinc transport protein ZntB [Roseovarius litorisediminis]
MDGVSQWRIDKAGQGKPIDLGAKGLAGLDVSPPGFVWVHVDCGRQGAQHWLEGIGLEPLVQRALLAPETRPRCSVHGDGVLMNLRGVNLNPGDEVEDMVSLRMWITEQLVVTVQMRRLMAVSDVQDAVARGQGPDGAAELVARLALRLADRAEPVVAGLNEKVDVLEDQVIEGLSSMSRRNLGDIRRVSIMLRRHMAPQRDALSTFEIEDLPWVRMHDRSRLREATERMTRLAEELDAIRDRAQVVHDQIMDTRAEAMNRQMLVLSVVAAIFLPLGLITGLLGINVGGMPGANYGGAFWIVTAGLVVLGLMLFWIFWKMGWLGRN